MSRPEQPLVTVENLYVKYQVQNRDIRAVNDVSLSIFPGETVAIVGESGSGKSTLAGALMGLLAGNARITGGKIAIAGDDVTHFSETRWRQLRGRTVGLVPQDPMVALNPTMRIGRQIGEVVRRVRGSRGRALDADVLELLEQVGLDQPLLRARQYPHELSGGQRQRVLIAIAVAGRPRLLIADEPTSALDVTVQRRILDHLETLVRSQGISMLIITHDLGVAADRADRVLIMQSGRIMEQGDPATVLAAPAHDYTRMLLQAAPVLNVPPRPASPDLPAREILRFEQVGKAFRLPGARGQASHFQALDAVSFSVAAGQTLAIVGESGSGKTTSLRIALGLEQATAGRVIFDGATDLSRLSWSQFRPLRRRMQLVQQNPYASLDPRLTIFESIVEPLRAFGLLKGAALESEARSLIDQVQLPRAMLNRLPRELSGGQRQRVAIARALALKPELLFLDEPVSALDVSVQAQILELLGELQRELGVSYVLVSHDLAVVAAVAHHIVVLRQGRVVEQGPAAQVFGSPAETYTRELLDAVPGRRLIHQAGGRPSAL
ncbi:dipeptide ABC transporter ATP-binding protein [Brenneria tiliae]|uniref:dipeptide ABC transporter ATP-binding protein n=1 Tax=Brenneria tiliae TaxID=2914984 RepID=UPI002014D612|nr:ABC transporter ATP-binding protein [Brenneria tiliae]MCL2896556.1 ABC transporter ATP-binding protein [Brenneria tiliae]MCL2901194.1 ABC transporter ATP-binding protein [Brenneria tiliae]